MALLRQSQDTDAARLAAAQAEFNEKKWVWVPDDRDGYLAGWVVKEEGDMGDVVMAAGGEVCFLSYFQIKVYISCCNEIIDQNNTAVRIIEDEPSKVRSSG